jgi:hypothetical protein
MWRAVMVRLKRVAVVMGVAVLAGCSTLDLASITGTGGSDGEPRESIVPVEDYGTVELEATTYEGDLIVDATSAWIFGAGPERTIINGDLIISGNRNEIRGVRVTGRVRLSGDRNKIIQSDLSNTTIIDTGDGNEY